jgi:rare lipoprotein A (peptidoglycan hydrolase)
MRVPSRIGIVILSAWIGIHVNPAAAQSFQERFSIVPKANAAEPNGPVPQTQPQTQPSTGAGAASRPASGADSARPEDRSGSRSVKRSVKRSFTGKASYYSYTTGKTASGLLFNRNSLTAAHRTLPFGTRVRVTDVVNRKSVTVTITDRGPWVSGRVLDLSLAAARVLGITDRGVRQVRAELL